MSNMTIVGNYTKQTGGRFPIDAETFDAIQSNQAILAALGNIAGRRAIIYDCEVVSTYRHPGYIFVATDEYPLGEILWFPGGDAGKPELRIVRENVAVSAQGIDFPAAYTRRRVEPADVGQGSVVQGTALTWASLTPAALAIPDLLALTAEQGEHIAALEARHDPVGAVHMYAGYITYNGETYTGVPDNFMVCDGGILNKNDYPELYKAFYISDEAGCLYDKAAVGALGDGEFRLPDMRNLFVAGCDYSGVAGNIGGILGGVGGHLNIVDKSSNANNGYLVTPDGADEGWSQAEQVDGSVIPPYITLSYIIRVK